MIIPFIICLVFISCLGFCLDYLWRVYQNTLDHLPIHETTKLEKLASAVWLTKGREITKGDRRSYPRKRLTHSELLAQMHYTRQWTKNDSINSNSL